ncbi:MAG: hydrogenase maturation nickel metallochaperone HypA [Thermoproteota archaeon]|nr:hydrogenase maturation nickel metallochaperone HypA [Thermoproteota archaeon]
MLALFLTILGIDYLRARRMMKKMGISSIRDMLGRLSVPMGYQKVKYYCMSCGNEDREISCPNCGSKMKRVG